MNAVASKVKTTINMSEIMRNAHAAAKETISFLRSRPTHINHKMSYRQVFKRALWAEWNRINTQIAKENGTYKESAADYQGSSHRGGTWTGD